MSSLYNETCATTSAGIRPQYNFDIDLDCQMSSLTNLLVKKQKLETFTARITELKAKIDKNVEKTVSSFGIKF